MSPSHSLPAIAKHMNRSINSVTVRAKRLGIKRSDRNGWFTLRETCQILGQDHHWVQKRMESGSLPAQRRNGAAPEASGHMWQIAAGDLAEFIKTHPEDLEGRNVDLVTIVETLCGLNPPQADRNA